MNGTTIDRSDEGPMTPSYNVGMAQEQTFGGAPPEGRPLLTIEEAAAYLGCSRRYMITLVHERRVAAIRFGHRTVRFDPADLDAYIAAHRVEATA